MTSITNNLEQAASELKKGSIVAIPTETVYGLAANAENEQAVLQVYSLKNRPLDHPLIMHVSKNWDLNKWVSFIPDYAQVLMQEFWPGPLTLVMSYKKGQINPLITGGQNTIAIRCPKHPLAQQLLEAVGFPLVAPSANPFGKISPTTAEHVQHSFEGKDLLILDGGRCAIGIESTILAAQDPKGYQILRQGMISLSMIEAIIPHKNLGGPKTIQVPGSLENHYQPEKPLYCFEQEESLKQFVLKNSAKVFVLSFKKFNQDLSYQFSDDPKAMAYELYYQLRKADESEAEMLAIELPPNIDEWQGVREKVFKASVIRYY
jgi:L-threonylcarbamoyladenylate synthase